MDSLKCNILSVWNNRNVCGLRLFFLLAFHLGTLPLFANQNHYLQDEDFRNLSGYQDYPFTNLNYSQITPGAFNGATELGPLFEYLKNKFHINIAVETGTYHGGTTIFFGLVFDQVHTIELVESTYQVAKANLMNYPNIECHLGSSERVLAELLPLLAGNPLLFYLDAHWENHWPLLDEISEIAKTHRDNCILVIDDFKVPGKRIPYDSYGNKECSYNYIENSLEKVFSEYIYYYLLPKNKSARAKFMAIPKHWLISETSSTY